MILDIVTLTNPVSVTTVSMFVVCHNCFADAQKFSLFSSARYRLSEISHLLAKVVMTVKYTSLNKMFAFSASLKWVMFLYH